MPSTAINSGHTPSTMFERHPSRSQCANMGDSLKNLALLDLSGVLTDINDRRWLRSNVNANVWYVDFTHMSMSAWSLSTASLSENAILKSSNARFLRPSPTLTCHQRRLNVSVKSPLVHLRLQSSRPPQTPSQQICGRRPTTARTWVWPHTGWMTTLVPTKKCLAVRPVQRRAATLST